MANRLDPELLRRLIVQQGVNPVQPADQNMPISSAERGLGLADMILAKKQAVQERERKLADAIAKAKQERELAAQLEGVNPLAGQAARVAPDEAAKQALSTLFAKPTKEAKPQFTKVGETGDEIIMVDPTNPSNQVRVKAPGVGGPNKQKPGVNKLAATLLGSIQQGATATGFIQGIENVTKKMSQATGLKGAGEALLFKGQEKAKGFFGGDKDVLAYETARPTMGRSLYKFLSGDVGNISESEGKFASDLLPSATEDPSLREAKLARLRDMKERANSAIAEVANISLNQNLTPQETEKMVKDAVVKIMQEAATLPAAPAPQPTGGSFRVLGRRPSGGQ